MKFLNYVGFKKYDKSDITRMASWIIISYVIIGLGIAIQFVVFKLTYPEFIARVKTITWPATIGYGIFSFLQEVSARGLLQHIMKDLTHSSFWSIVITTIVFCACHVHYSWFVIFGAFIISIICGIVYDKHQDTMSCFLIHYIVGGFGGMLLYI